MRFIGTWRLNATTPVARIYRDISPNQKATVFMVSVLHGSGADILVNGNIMGIVRCDKQPTTVLRQNPTIDVELRGAGGVGGADAEGTFEIEIEQ